MKTGHLSQRTKNRTNSIALILFALSLAVVIVLASNTKTITGMITANDMVPNGFTFVDRGNISNEQIETEFKIIEQEIAAMKERGFTMSYVSDLFLEAHELRTDGDLSDGDPKEDDLRGILERLQLIHYIYQRKVEFVDLISLLQMEEEQLIGRGINTDNAHVFLDDAQNAFEHDQLDTAFALLDQYDQELEKVRIEESLARELTNFGRNFLQKYWWAAIIFLIIMGSLVSLLFLKYQRKKSMVNVKKLSEELAKIEKLIIGLRNACFIERKISIKTYNRKLQKYEERMLEIKKLIPLLEAIAQEGKKTLGTKNSSQKFKQEPASEMKSQDIRVKAKGIIEVKK